MLDMRREVRVARIEKERKAREVGEDGWMAEAVRYLKAKRKDLDGFGIGEHFFARSLKELRRLDGEDGWEANDLE